MREKKGFTLLEVLIALAILALAFIALMRLFPAALRQARVAAERTVVARLADTKVGRLRAAGADRLLQQMDSINWVYRVYAADAMYDGYQTTLRPLRGAEEGSLQRITFTVNMPDGRTETFVTYVAKQ